MFSKLISGLFSWLLPIPKSPEVIPDNVYSKCFEGNSEAPKEDRGTHAPCVYPK